MASNNNIPPDHIDGGFSWQRKPFCSCGRLAQAFDDKFIFASNFVDDTKSPAKAIVYMMPEDAEGDTFRASGVPISHCPWCGDLISVLKK